MSRTIILAVGVVCVLLILTGCASHPVVKTVQVPVAAECPAPPAVSRPLLPLSDIRATDTPAEVMRAYAASLEALMGYSELLEMALDAYRTEK